MIFYILFACAFGIPILLGLIGVWCGHKRMMENL